MGTKNKAELLEPSGNAGSCRNPHEDSHPIYLFSWCCGVSPALVWPRPFSPKAAPAGISSCPSTWLDSAKGNLGAPIPGSHPLAVHTHPWLVQPAFPRIRKQPCTATVSSTSPESQAASFQAAGDLRQQGIKQELRLAGICN